MNVNKLTLSSPEFPERLRTIATPPASLFTQGSPLSELLAQPCVTVVGSRKVSSYGREVTTQLAGGLARAGIVIVSGLALGVDAIAHRAALDAGGLTIAVLPGSIECIYPSSHRQLAQRIVGQGGALVTEYPAGTITYPVNFIARNRIASALSDAVLITEAAKKSGTLHTARFALEQGKEVLAVPGNITSQNSAGTNLLIQTGAAPITSVQDILRVLGIHRPTTKPLPKGDTPAEQKIISLVAAGEQDGNALLLASDLDVAAFNQALTMLEIRGHIYSLGANTWALA